MVMFMFNWTDSEYITLCPPSLLSLVQHRLKRCISHEIFPSMALLDVDAELFLFPSRQQKGQRVGIYLQFPFPLATITTHVIVLVFFVRLPGRGKVAAPKKAAACQIYVCILERKRPAPHITSYPITSSSRIPPHRQPQAPSLYATLSSWVPLRSASEGCRKTIPWPRRPLSPRACLRQLRPHRRR